MVENTPVVNPLLTKLRIPGETFRLPSGGIFYTHGELADDVKNGEVLVYPLTALDEIILKTPDKLLSGEAITEVFTNCIPSIKDPTSLFAKDVDYLLVCIRMLTYGPTFDVSWTHSCEGAKEHVYSIDLRQFIKNSRSIDPTTAVKNFQVTMENGQTVKIIPPRFKNLLDIYQAIDNDSDMLKLRDQLILNLARMIDTVEDTTDTAFINEWLRKIPANWIKKITEVVESNSNWGPTFSVKVNCKDCNHEVEISTPLNPVAFFT